MNDLAYYKLLNKVKFVESLLRERIRPRLHFAWNEDPLLPLEVAKLCNQACSVLAEIGEYALKAVDVEEASKRAALGNPGPDRTTS